MTTKPENPAALLDTLLSVVTPENVRLGHTWLKKKLREAYADAMLAERLAERLADRGKE